MPKSNKEKRRKKKCPILECSKEVVHLPRHLRQSHGWSKERSLGALSTFDLREKREIKKERKGAPRMYKRRVCPFPGCIAVVRRLHNHLRGKHKLSREDERYRSFLHSAAFEEIDETKEEEIITISSSSSSSRVSVESFSEKEASSESGSSIIPPSRDLEEARLLHKQLFSKETRLPPRTRPRLEGEQETASLWERAKQEESNQLMHKSTREKESKKKKEQKQVQPKKSREDEEDIVPDDDDSDVDVDDDDEDYQETFDGDDESLMNDNESDDEFAANGNQVTDDVLNSFSLWLQSIDGGRRELRTAKQYSSQIHSIIMAVDPIYQDVHTLFNKQAVRDKWLTKLEKKRQPGTCKAYLASLAKFFKFLMVEAPKTLSISHEQARKMKEQALEWMASYKSPIAKRKQEKQKSDMENVITAHDVKKFDTSAMSRKAVSTLGRHLDSTTCPLMSDFCLVRDFLMTSICINNACRAGPLANMTLQEFNKPKQEDDQLVVIVMKHKTFNTHGPAPVVFSRSLYTWVKNYIGCMRGYIPGVSNQDQDKVFISWSGSDLTSSMVSSQINSCWNKAMTDERGNNGNRTNATSFRKAVVTVIHGEHQHLKKDVADLMCHNEKTADKFYSLRDKLKRAAKTSAMISKIIRTPVETETRPDETETRPDDVAANPVETEIRPVETDAGPGETEARPSISNTSSQTHRHSWTPLQIEATQLIFNKNIKEGKITIDEVRTKIRNSCLEGIPFEKIRDRVRAEIKQSRKREILELPSEQETTEQKMERLEQNESVLSVRLPATEKETKEQKTEWEQPYVESQEVNDVKSSLYSSRTFTEDQTKIMYDVCGDLIHSTESISTREVLTKLNDHPAAKDFIKQFTPLQLCSKIRTERKRLKRLSKK